MTRDHRLTINLTNAEDQALRATAALRDEPPSRTAARLLNAALTPAALPLDHTEPPTPPRWLPADAGPDWRDRAWAAGEALRNRYPQTLESLADDWPINPEVRDALLALVAWREDLDTGQHPDPRTELAFHAALRDIGRWTHDHRRHSPGYYADQPRQRPADW